MYESRTCSSMFLVSVFSSSSELAFHPTAGLYAGALFRVHPLFELEGGMDWIPNASATSGGLQVNSADHTASNRPASPSPPPMNAASGAGNPISASGAWPCTMRRSGVPSAAALRVARAARSAPSSMPMRGALPPLSFRWAPLQMPFRGAQRRGVSAGAAATGARARCAGRDFSLRSE